MPENHRVPRKGRSPFELLPHPSVEEIRSGLEGWAARRPGRLEVTRLGESASGRPILAALVTDRDVPDGNKQRVLLTASHAGGELNACTGLLRFTRWLLEDDPAAGRCRKNFLVAVVPCLDPDGYESRPPRPSRPSPYRDWTWEGPGESPESRAVFALMEQLCPEVHVDVHGLGFSGQYMWESTGISWAAPLCRCPEPLLPRFIDDYAERRGYLVTRGEADAGRLLSTAVVPGAGQHFYLQRQGFNFPLVSYHRYHSLAFCVEAGFDESIAWRMRGLLEAGRRAWRYQGYRGFPCDYLGAWGSVQLAPWGDTAARRRESRVALWRHAGYTGLGMAHPEHRGTVGALVVFDPRELVRLGYPGERPASGKSGKPLADQVEILAARPGFEAGNLRSWLARRPKVPRHYPFTDGFSISGPSATGPPPGLPQHGAVVRLLLPFRTAKVTETTLDGHRLARSKSEGYTITRGPGCVVHVSIPPGRLRGMHLVTCRVEPGEERRDGFRPADWNLDD